MLDPMRLGLAVLLAAAIVAPSFAEESDGASLGGSSSPAVTPGLAGYHPVSAHAPTAGSAQHPSPAIIL